MRFHKRHEFGRNYSKIKKKASFHHFEHYGLHVVLYTSIFLLMQFNKYTKFFELYTLADFLFTTSEQYTVKIRDSAPPADMPTHADTYPPEKFTEL